MVKLGSWTFKSPKEMMSTSTRRGLQRSKVCLPIFTSISFSDDKSSTGFSLVSISKAQLRKILFQEFGAFLGNKGADRNIEEVFRI